MSVPPQLSGCSRAAARVVWSHTCRAIVEYVRELVPTRADSHSTPGEFLTYALRVRGMSLALLDAAIYLERAAGTSWEQLAAIRSQDVDDLRRSYADADDPQACAERVADLLGGDVAHVARQLDEWCRTGGVPLHPAEGPHPVTGGLF